jgi:hypothetical protein
MGENIQLNARIMKGAISQNAPLTKKKTTPYHPNFFIQIGSCKDFWNIPVFNVRMVVFPSPVKR